MIAASSASTIPAYSVTARVLDQSHSDCGGERRDRTITCTAVAMLRTT